MRSYTYRHIVTFEDTSVAGNVYYVNHLRWQGRCRELFLHEYAPEVVRDLREGLLLVTTRCACEYFAELAPLDEVEVRMTLREIAQNRITMQFEYFRVSGGGGGGEDVLVARGEQQVATMRRDGARLVPAEVPEKLRAALLPYAAE